MPEVPTIEEIQKLRVVDLRERLSKLGLPTAGLKADLVERLHEALVRMNEDSDESEGPGEEEASEKGSEVIAKEKSPIPSSPEADSPPSISDHKSDDEKDLRQSLLEKQKEALALEQVRLLEQEKAIQDRVLLRQGQQQHQMLEEERERQERLEEQKERAMARVQQRMIAREEQEKTMLAHQQHQMLEQQKILEEQKKEQELMQLQQQALIEKTIEMVGVSPQQVPPPGLSISLPSVPQAVAIPLGFTPVQSTIVIAPPAPVVSHSVAPVGIVTMALPGPPVSMVPTTSTIMSSVSMASTMTSPINMVTASSVIPPTVSMIPTGVQITTTVSTPMGAHITSMVQSPMSMAGPPPPPMPMGGPPPPPRSLAGPLPLPPPPVSMAGPPPPPMSIAGPPLPPMSMSGPIMTMAGQPPTSMVMSGPPQPPMSMTRPLMSMAGPPQPTMTMGGPPQPLMSMGGPQPPPHMAMTGPPPMNMSGPPPGILPPPHMNMMRGPPPTSIAPSMVPPPGPPSMRNLQGPPSQRHQGPPTSIHQGPPTSIHQGPPTSIHQGPPTSIHQGPPPPLHQGPPPNIHQGPPLLQGPPPNNMTQGPPINLNQGPPPTGNQIPRPPMHQGPPPSIHQRPPPTLHPPRGGPNMVPPPRPPMMMGMGEQRGIPPRSGGRTPLRGDSRDQKEGEERKEEPHMLLPQAIEKVLQYKSERVQEHGLESDDLPQEEDEEIGKGSLGGSERRPSLPPRPLVAVDEGEDDDMDEDEQPQPREQNKVKESKNVRRKKKRARQKRLQQQKQHQQPAEEPSIGPLNEEIEIIYVPDKVESTDPFYYQFLHIFEKFKLKEAEQKELELTEEERKERTRQEEQALRLAERKKPADIDDKDDDDDDKKEDEKPKLSKRKLKKLNRMSIAELKQKVTRPELVEMHDVTAKDPVLLLHLKAARNSVPVPRHWCFKRKYLQGKRGIEKAPFDLPEFIKRTGIMEMRQALQEKEEQKTMKAKMRERVRPKMGKIDIDYQKLHDAFFKWQIKPRMTIHGDIYYEGKEFETRLKEKKPGDLSDDLRVALGMPIGQNAQKCPPPWLIAMQRYGPPPSYPNLKIPGLNAPIPEGCSFGYHAGGWGKPPVDETGRPLYGDVFGTQLTDLDGAGLEEEVDRSLWGELESESSEESEEESSEEEEKTEDETGLVTPAEGLVTPSGLSSVPAGMETPDIIELRKRKIEAEMEGGETPALYTILPEKQTEKVGTSMMGSTHVYDMSAAIQASRAKVSGAVAAMMPPDGVEVTLDPSELEMDSVAMAARYEQTVREQQSQLAKEDLSDMVAEHAARQKNKRKKQQQDTGKTAKKYKEFKF